MDCRILRSLTLKSDGHLCCDDSSGYHLHLGEVSTKRGWNIRKVFEGPVWKHVRESFQNGHVPWPGTCDGCDLLSPGAAPLDTLGSNVEVRVEPTLACDLRCPCCTRMGEVRRREGEWHLSPALFESLLKSCAGLGIEVPRIVYLGMGEPLEHPDFSRLVHLASEIVPDAQQEVCTNGNQSYLESVGASRLDRIIVSCDGSRQESYSKYRIRGEIARALQFMRDVRKFAGHRPFLEWKYILFEFNDSDEELLEAQKMAEEFDVDSIMFIVTNSRFHSKRFLSDGLQSFPRASPLTSVSPAAGMQKVLRSGKTAIGRSGSGGGPTCQLYLDHANLLTCGVIRLEGWVLCADGAYADRVEVHLGDDLVSSSRPIHRRPDVKRSIPQAAGPDCGFILQFPFPQGVTAPSHGDVTVGMRIKVKIGDSVQYFDGASCFPAFDPAVFSADYHLPAPAPQPRDQGLVTIGLASQQVGSMAPVSTERMAGAIPRDGQVWEPSLTLNKAQ